MTERHHPTAAQVRSSARRLAATLVTLAEHTPDSLDPGLCHLLAEIVRMDGDDLARDYAAVVGLEGLLGLACVHGRRVPPPVALTSPSSTEPQGAA